MFCWPLEAEHFRSHKVHASSAVTEQGSDLLKLRRRPRQSQLLCVPWARQCQLERVSSPACRQAPAQQTGNGLPCCCDR